MTSHEQSDDVVTIRDGIEHTRAEMTRTVNAIEERLSPAHLKEQVTSVKEHVVDQIRGVTDQAKARVRDATVGRVENMMHDARDTVRDAGSGVLETIKANPVPSALVAIGLGWLVMNSRTGSIDEGTYYAGGYDIEGRRMRRPRRALQRGQRALGEAVEKAEGKASEIAEGAKQAAHDVGESASQVAHEAQEKGRRVVRRAGRQARRVEQSFETTLRDNPLAVGAVAVAIGAAIGLLLPRTAREDELMGRAKGRIIEKAEGAAKQGISKVKETAEKVAETAGGVAGQLGASEQGRAEEPRSQPNGGIGSGG